jgi:hypothetical protein
MLEAPRRKRPPGGGGGREGNGWYGESLSDASSERRMFVWIFYFIVSHIELLRNLVLDFLVLDSFLFPCMYLLHNFRLELYSSYLVLLSDSFLFSPVCICSAISVLSCIVHLCFSFAFTS